MIGPPWMPGPATPDARAPYTDGAKVIDQQPGPGGTVRVTFVLPGFIRRTITVPESAWREGEHLRIIPHMVGYLRAVDVQPFLDSPG